MSKSVLAWHFIQPDKKERFKPHRDIVVGETLSCDPDKLSPCNYGLHSSKKPMDALSFLQWENAWICRVRLSGKIIEYDDKLCAEKRTVLWMAPADKTLHEFSCWCAEQTLYLFEKEYPKDKRPRAAIQAKRDFLNGKITTKELAAARDAAVATAWDAAVATARAAAWDAAVATARAAAWDAARDAAVATARAAAWDAAWAAAWAAAWDAARDAQNQQLESMLKGLKP